MDSNQHLEKRFNSDGQTRWSSRVWLRQVEFRASIFVYTLLWSMRRLRRVQSTSYHTATSCLAKFAIMDLTCNLPLEPLAEVLGRVSLPLF